VPNNDGHPAGARRRCFICSQFVRWGGKGRKGLTAFHRVATQDSGPVPCPGAFIPWSRQKDLRVRPKAKNGPTTLEEAEAQYTPRRSAPSESYLILAGPLRARHHVERTSVTCMTIAAFICQRRQAQGRRDHAERFEYLYDRLRSGVEFAEDADGCIVRVREDEPRPPRRLPTCAPEFRLGVRARPPRWRSAFRGRAA
jgi:hypothetical protein